MTDRMIFGMRVLNITQAGTVLTDKPSLSHVSYELDLAGSDSGVDYWYNWMPGTWLINSGVNVVAVSKRLGHADINQTLETYTHLLASTDQGMQIELMIELRVEFLVMVMASLIMEF